MLNMLSTYVLFFIVQKFLKNIGSTIGTFIFKIRFSTYLSNTFEMKC